ncbi:2-hydroxyisoflavanone dehydratase [Hibiscus syriacus]|uniref:2-hydroxyisoflavanone dehydratase n=1 Tax=Hibiscus syriacus TaxID=106335 RepID=A0A6A3BRB8_HIBSY|nr:2-hydroxyisoflavanone dehydratase-like [Hibiscus syriacus]KAE8717602.1 2-hydroxyisoflavanone dehydratase [Hibiscus syriacus]
MGSNGKEVATEILPFLRVYKDGSVKRFAGSPIVPPCADDPETGVSSKDIIVSQDPPISARIYLPKQVFQQHKKVPILVYFHGGAFCIESAFSFVETKFMNRLARLANAVVVSIEYRLAPEHPLPIAYHDCWSALQWVVSHSDEEPWVSTYADFDRVYIGGDSSGSNIAHSILIRAGSEGLRNGVKIKGAFLTHPYFWGSKPIGSESKDVEKREKVLMSTVWHLVYPEAPGGVDNPMMNPVAPGAPSLAGLGCSRLLISVAEKDPLRDRGILYYNAVKDSGWQGELEWIDVEDEDHAFHILAYKSENANKHIKRLASFIVACVQEHKKKSNQLGTCVSRI